MTPYLKKKVNLFLNRFQSILEVPLIVDFQDYCSTYDSGDCAMGNTLYIYFVAKGFRIRVPK